MSYRCSRWPPDTSQMAVVDRLQNKLVAAALRVKMLPAESPADYVIRRNANGARAVRQTGKWSRKWCRRVLEWDAHIRRAHNPQQWSTKLVHFHDDSWLSFRRLVGRQGRPGTRISSGHPTTRWAEGVNLASDIRDNER